MADYDNQDTGSDPQQPAKPGGQQFSLRDDVQPGDAVLHLGLPLPATTSPAIDASLTVTSTPQGNEFTLHPAGSPSAWSKDFAMMATETGTLMMAMPPALTQASGTPQNVKASVTVAPDGTMTLVILPPE